MASVNKVILVGNLGADPEVRYMPSGEAVANVSLATTDKWKDKQSGEMKEATEWHRISFFGRLAEIAGEYLKKGSAIYVEGSIHTRKFQDKETGQDRYSTSIKALSLQMLGGKRDRDEDDEDDDVPPARQQSKNTNRGGGFGDMDDDIPFAPIGRGIGGHAI